ncbi:TetR/AcrR family transcriptional regulator [Kribbella deserti]|uniref:TetR/AcrR family transcriptional regulator n=1 Tax=Kribbella deserti TaxID=1926257 RepID=A0ABV6QIN3_9ACTN
MATISPGDQPEPLGYSLRRVPTQDRASAQVERILDAACVEVTERGYDTASTSSIAKRAGIAVGSVYRYFPDKRALMQAVERRNQRRYAEAVRERMATVTGWREAVDVTLDTFREMHGADPGFRAVALSGLGDPDLETTPGEFDDDHAAEFGDLLVSRFGARESREFRLAVTMSITMGEAVAHLADRLPEADATHVLVTGRAALHQLLEPHLP